MKADQHHAWQSAALPEGSWRVVLAAYPQRVCRTRHRTNGVEVPVPGRSRAEGKEKGTLNTSGYSYGFINLVIVIILCWKERLY